MRTCDVHPGGPVTLPYIVEIDGPRGSFGACLLCYARMTESAQIEPTARKGGKPAPTMRAGKRDVKIGGAT